MNPSDHEALSRWIAGDLPHTEAKLLEERLTQEPELAQAHADLSLVLSAIGDLDEEAAPPPLDPRVLPKAKREWSWGVPWVLAAAALLFVFLRPAQPSPEVVLIAGDNLVDGTLNLWAGDVQIELDGRARIFVEPAEDSSRVVDQNALERDMKTPLLIGTLAGAAITITLYEGFADVRAPNAPAERIEADGRAREYGTPASTSRAADRTKKAPEDRIAALEAELAETRKELDTAKFSGALVRGQLSAERGLPSLWDGAEVPSEMTPENFEASLRSQIEGLEGFEIHHVDCDEYPCVAVIEHVGDAVGSNWKDPLGEKVSAWTEETLGNHSMSTNTSRFRNGEHEARFLLFGAHGADDEVNLRTDWRIEQMVQELGAETAARSER